MSTEVQFGDASGIRAGGAVLQPDGVVTAWTAPLPPRQRRQNHENHTWLLIMLAQLYQQVDRMPIKPPITLGVSALCFSGTFSIAFVSISIPDEV